MLIMDLHSVAETAKVKLRIEAYAVEMAKKFHKGKITHLKMKENIVKCINTTKTRNPDVRKFLKEYKEDFIKDFEKKRGKLEKEEAKIKKKIEKKKKK